MAPLTIPNFKDPKDLTSEDLKQINPKGTSRTKIEQQGGLDLSYLPELEAYIKWLGKSGLLELQGIDPAEVTFEKFLETQRWEIRLAAAERDLFGGWAHIAHNRSLAAGGYHGLWNTAPDLAYKNVKEGARSGINPKLAQEAGFPTDRFNAYLDFALSQGKNPYPTLTDPPADRKEFFHGRQSIEAIRATTELARRRVFHPESAEVPPNLSTLLGVPWGMGIDNTTAVAESGKVTSTYDPSVRNRTGFKPGQQGRVVSPFITPTQLPKAGPQEKVRLPQTTSVHGPKKNLSLPVTPPQEHLQIDPNPKPSSNPLDQVKIPQVLTSIHEQQMNRNPGEGIGTLLRLGAGIWNWVFSDVLRGAMP